MGMTRVVRLTFKTPDAVDRAISEFPEDEQEEVREAISKYVEYDEYVRIEIDVDTKIARVVEV